MRKLLQETEVWELPFSSGRGISSKNIYMELGKGSGIRMERLLSMVKSTKEFEPDKMITHSKDLSGGNITAYKLRV